MYLGLRRYRPCFSIAVSDQTLYSPKICLKLARRLTFHWSDNRAMKVMLADHTRCPKHQDHRLLGSFAERYLNQSIRHRLQQHSFARMTHPGKPDHASLSLRMFHLDRNELQTLLSSDDLLSWIVRIGRIGLRTRQ